MDLAATRGLLQSKMYRYSWSYVSWLQFTVYDMSVLNEYLLLPFSIMYRISENNAQHCPGSKPIRPCIQPNPGDLDSATIEVAGLQCHDHWQRGACGVACDGPQWPRVCPQWRWCLLPTWYLPSPLGQLWYNWSRWHMEPQVPALAELEWSTIGTHARMALLPLP